MAQENRHLTTEQLSDFLDGEVSLQEQAQWESHLKNCSLCQQELTSLRQVVAMLHALPPPVLPRSFVLPLETPQSDASPTVSAPIPFEAARRRQWQSYVRVAMRTVSAIAAVIGVFFLLSGLLSTVIRGGGTSSTTSSSSVATHSAPSTGNIEPSAQVSAVAGVATNEAKDTPTFAASRVTPTLPSMARVQPTQSVEAPSNSQQNVPSSSLDIFNLGAPIARLGAGMLLIIFGIMGTVLFKRQTRPRGE